jgi:hypothetical protein
MKKYKLFIDMDGVLCDFDKRIKVLTGHGAKEFENPSDFWHVVLRQKHLFDNLDWMKDGELLWNICRYLDPYILSSAPNGKKWERQKRQWVQEHLGLENDHVIIAHPRVTKIQKALEHFELTSIPKNESWILIDDWYEQNGQDWIKGGGVFVHHTSLEGTLIQLSDISVISNQIERAIDTELLDREIFD